jgi:hypothetical protein
MKSKKFYFILSTKSVIVVPGFTIHDGLSNFYLDQVWKLC